MDESPADGGEVTQDPQTVELLLGCKEDGENGGHEGVLA